MINVLNVLFCFILLPSLGKDTTGRKPLLINSVKKGNLEKMPLVMLS